MKKRDQKAAPVELKKKSVMAIVAEDVKSARLRAGMTQKELADRVGTSMKGITRLESGEYNNTTIGTLVLVAEGTKSVLDVRLKPRKTA